MYIGLIAPTIARMTTNSLSEILLDGRYERVLSRQIEAVKSVVCRLETSRQGAGIEALRCGNLLRRDL